MVKNLQKSDVRYRELHMPHKGILDPERYARNFHLRCYEPSPELRLFVEHIWVSRWDLRDDPMYTATDILTRPTVNLFFMPKASFIGGIMDGRRTYNAQGIGVMAGAKFKPGGLYPFWKQSMVRFAGKNVPMTDVFPLANGDFSRELLALNDDCEIAARIETLLRNGRPAYDDNSKLINDVIHKIETDISISTVTSAAQACAVHERTLQRLFRKQVGVGVKWVIQRNRFLEAIRQVHLGQKPNWTRLAAELGYSNQSHLANDFKKHIGKAPSEYTRTIEIQPVVDAPPSRHFA